MEFDIKMDGASGIKKSFSYSIAPNKIQDISSEKGSKTFQQSFEMDLGSSKEAKEFYDSVYKQSGEILFRAYDKLDEFIRKAIKNKGFASLSDEELKLRGRIIYHEGVKTLFIDDVVICYFKEPEFNFDLDNFTAIGECKISEA